MVSEKVCFQESKEYQLKVDVDGRFGPGGATDQALFEAVSRAIRQAVASLGEPGEVLINDNLWHREGIRYDAADGRLKANNLTLAIEATDKRTKLKCKEHDFLPEVLFENPEQSICLPDIKVAGDYKKHDTTLKREQDIHLDNIKFCGSGSLYVKGRQTGDKESSFFVRYFPGLAALFPKAVALRAVSHWDESVFDDMSVRWGKCRIDSWMLVNRRDFSTGKLLESELSFKVAKKLDDAWDRRHLKAAARLYLALQETGLFQELPAIFTFGNPVSSIDIIRAPAEVAA